MGNIGRPAAIYGTDAAIEQGTKLRWSLHTGEQQVRTFTGPADKVWTLYGQYKAYAADVPEIDDIQFSADRGVGTLEVVKNNGTVIDSVAYGGVGVEPEPRWELLPIEERVPIEMHPVFSSIGESDLRAVVEAVLNKQEPQTDWQSGSNGDIRGKLYDLMIRGTTDLPMFMWVARKTTITTKRNVLAAAYDGVGRASTTAPDIKNPIFIGIKQQNVDWLCRPPSVREIERRLWELSQEWWGIPFDPADTKGRCGWSSVAYGGRALP